MNRTIKDALNLAQRIKTPIRYHQTIARRGYATDGLVETPLTTGEPETVPERPETLGLQLQQLVQGKRSAVFVSNASPNVVVPPKMKVVQTREGQIFFNPKKIDQDRVVSAVRNGELNKLLDYVQPKGEAQMQSFAQGVRPNAVVSRNGDGIEQDAAIVSPGNEEEQAQIFADRAEPGSTVGVEDPDFETVPNRMQFDNGGYVDGHVAMAQPPYSFRRGYATDGSVEGVPEEESQEDFIKKELEGSAKQYDPEAGILTGKRAGLMGAGFAPGSGLVTAAGKFPTAEGGFEPSVKEDIKSGHYGSAALKTLGAAGDVAYAVPFVGPAAGAALKLPLALKFAASIAPAAKVAGEAATAAREAAPVVEAAVEAAPQLTKKQSLAAMVEDWAKGGGKRDQYNSPHHQWNIEEKPKFEAATPVVQQPVVKKASVGFVEPEEYERVTNPAGYYSHGAEVARQMKQQKGTPEQMIEALRSAGVKPEEIKWSGIEKAFANQPRVTGEELATHFEKNLPKVNRIEKASGDVADLEQELYEQYQQEEVDRLYQEEYDDDLQRALDEHDLEGMSERERERLQERIEEQISENYYERASEDASRRAREEASEQGPKWGSDEYNFPGGYDYREHVLQFPHVNMNKLHPETLNPMTRQTREELNRAYRETRANYSDLELEQRRAQRAFAQENATAFTDAHVNNLKAQGHKFATEEQVNAAKSRMDDAEHNYQAYMEAAAQSQREGRTEEAAERMAYAKAARHKLHDAQGSYNDLISQTEPFYRDRVERTARNGDYDLNEMGLMLGKEQEVAQLKNNPELDQARELADKAYKEQQDFEKELKKTSDELYGDIPEYEKQLYQSSSHWGDIENPFWHGRYKTYNYIDPKTGEELKVLNKSESQSDMAKQDFLREHTPEEAEKVDLLRAHGVNRTPEQNLELAQLLGRESEGIFEAPYVGSTEKWSEIAAKDALAHAIENDFDRIFITGGEEQANRWSGTMREKLQDINWRTIEDRSTNVPPSVQDQYARAMYGKNRRQLDYEQARNLETDINRIMLGLKPEVFPEGIYKMPREERHITLRLNDGTTRELLVKNIKQPDGKMKPIVVDSSFGANGKSLSELLGSDVADRVAKNDKGSQDMKGYRLASSGYEDVYDKAHPKAYRKIMKSLDPDAKIETGTLPTPRGMKEAFKADDLQNIFDNMTPEQQSSWGDKIQSMMSYLNENRYNSLSSALNRFADPELRKFLTERAKLGRQGTWIHITPKMKEEYWRLKRKFGAVFPAYKRGGAVSDKLNAITKRGLPIAERLTRADGGSAFKINRKTQEPVRGLKITPPAEELSDDPEIRRYQMARHAHEFIGSEEPEAPRRPVVLDAPLLGGKKELFSVPYQYHPAIEKALKLAYGQKTLPLYATPETTPIGRALDAYEAAKFIQQDPSNPANYTGVPGTLWKIAGSEVPAVAAGAILAKDEGKARQNGRGRTIFEKLFDFDVAPSVISHPKSEELPMRGQNGLEFADGGDVPAPPRRPQEFLPEDARNAFPHLMEKHDPIMKLNLGRQEGFSETYPPGETGDPKNPNDVRPKEFPMERTGIEVYDPREKGVDYALELLHVDPRSEQTRNRLMQSFSPQQKAVLKDGWLDYDTSRVNEQRAYQNAIDGVIRAYLANKTGLPHMQAPMSAIEDLGLSKDQLRDLDELYEYARSGKSDKR